MSPPSTLLFFFSIIVCLTLTLCQLDVHIDTQYDDPLRPVRKTTCAKLLLDRGYTQYGEIPAFPHVVGSSFVTTDMVGCGDCWKLFTPRNPTGVYVRTIQHATVDFAIGQKTWDALGLGNDNDTEVPLHPTKRKDIAVEMVHMASVLDVKSEDSPCGYF